MIDIFRFSDYREFLHSWLKAQPKGGWGLLGKWARTLRIHPTYLSQILSGVKELNLEVAEGLSRIVGLSDLETNYFLLLVQHERAGTQSLKTYWKKKIRDAQEKSKRISERLSDTKALDDKASAEFYSSALYSGVRNLCAIPGRNSVDELADRLKVPRTVIQRVLEFLLEYGLVVRGAAGYEIGPRRSHIPATSPFVQKHHQNWRLEAFQKMRQKNSEDLFFTFPMSLSQKDSEKIRGMLLHTIEEIHKVVGPSPSECVRCLNLDYFEY